MKKILFAIFMLAAYTAPANAQCLHSVCKIVAAEKSMAHLIENIKKDTDAFMSDDTLTIDGEIPTSFGQITIPTGHKDDGEEFIKTGEIKCTAVLFSTSLLMKYVSSKSPREEVIIDVDHKGYLLSIEVYRNQKQIYVFDATAPVQKKPYGPLEPYVKRSGEIFTMLGMHYIVKNAFSENFPGNTYTTVNLEE